MIKQQIIQYFENMKQLKSQSVPLDWFSVAEMIVNTVKTQPDPAEEQFEVPFTMPETVE